MYVYLFTSPVVLFPKNLLCTTFMLFFYSLVCSSFPSPCFYIFFHDKLQCCFLLLQSPSRKFLCLTLLVVVLLLLLFYCTFLRGWLTASVWLSCFLSVLPKIMCVWSEKNLKEKKTLSFCSFLYIIMRSFDVQPR